MNLTDDELRRRLGDKPEIGAEDRSGVRCDNCAADQSRKVVTKHRKKAYGYSVCTGCLIRMGFIW